MKREISVFEHADQILQALKEGVLLTTKAEGRVNTMTIGWGMLGIEWRRPVFITYVREGRFTAEQLAGNPEFTVNVPVGAFDKRILGFCGSTSGRNTDKLAELRLTPVEADTVAPPAIRELPLTLECRVIYSRKQAADTLPAEIFENCYPRHIPGDNPRSNRDFHIEYYGEITKAYVLEDD